MSLSKTEADKSKPKKIKVTFLDNDSRIEVEAPVGMNLLEVAHQNNVDLEGACEGSLACSTCHVIIVENDFVSGENSSKTSSELAPKAEIETSKNKVTFSCLAPASEEENDMLDLAYGLTRTSRLGCQIILKDELDGLVVRLPNKSRNFNV